MGYFGLRAGEADLLGQPHSYLYSIVLELDSRVVWTKALEGRLVECLLVVRMGDADERLCTLLH